MLLPSRQTSHHHRNKNNKIGQMKLQHQPHSRIHEMNDIHSKTSTHNSTKAITTLSLPFIINPYTREISRTHNNSQQNDVSRFPYTFTNYQLREQSNITIYGKHQHINNHTEQRNNSSAKKEKANMPPIK